MDKTLEFTTKSPRQIKQGDTETTFTFICKSAGSAVDLTQATNITVKIGNASGYLRSQSIAITSLAGLNQGWLNLQPTPTLISGLPAGDYQLEIWVIDQAGTSIYPSDKPLGFTITNNIENESGETITTITFDDFVKAMNKAASTIAKGDRGEKGDTPDLSNYVTVTDLNNGLSTKVTDNKNDTISVNGKSILPANENIIGRIDEEYTDMNDIPMGWMYLNGWTDVSGLANWGLPQGFYYIHCFKPEYSISTNIQIAYSISKNNTYMRTKSGTTWTTWKLLADDSKIAHLSGANNFDTVPTYGTGNKPFAINDTGATTARPTAGVYVGYQYFDTSLNKPIWYTGKNWVDATGTTV